MGSNDRGKVGARMRKAVYENGKCIYPANMGELKSLSLPSMLTVQ